MLLRNEEKYKKMSPLLSELRETTLLTFKRMGEGEEVGYRSLRETREDGVSRLVALVWYWYL